MNRSVTVRAGDAERERAVQTLADHCVHGRLTVEELDDRIGRAMTATLRSELEALVSDLPQATSPGAAENAKLWWPGVAAFHIERLLRAHIEVVFEDALRVIVPRMGMAGFTLRRERAPRLLDFVSADQLHVGVVLHPADDGGTVVAAFGEAPRGVRQAFATLRD